MPISTASACPHCGYELTGIPWHSGRRQCPECGASSTAAEAAKHARRHRRRHTLIRTATFLMATYAPYAWVVAIPLPSSAYDWMWFRFWPVLPAFAVFFFGRALGDGVALTAAGAVMLIGFALAWRLRHLRRGWWMTLITVLLAANIINAVLCHALKVA